MTNINDKWEPQAPPNYPEETQTNCIDPRVIQNHSIGQLPCPDNPPPPDGWEYWTNKVTVEEGNLALSILKDSKTFPMGSFVQTYSDGIIVGARVEWHNIQGATNKKGCFRGVNLMKQIVKVEEEVK
jgi:hypothetical protein